MAVCLLLVIPINHLTLLSSVAIVGGLYFSCLGFQLLGRKRLLLSTPTSKIRSAALGPVEVNGAAAGPYTIPAPITGRPCFLYRATAWRQPEGKPQVWQKIADETLHLPFFVHDSTGQLLLEPLGADLDLQRDFREEYAGLSLSSTSSSPARDDVPPRVSAFLSRHGVVPSGRLRLEESTIKPEDALFVMGTLMENPGVQVRPLSPSALSLHNNSPYGDGPHSGEPERMSETRPFPQIIRLTTSSSPSTTREMSQQGKIAAALTRAGITKPAAWSAAGVRYNTVAVEENAPFPPGAGNEAHLSDPRLQEHADSSEFNLTPPVALMKGANDSAFVISFRSQKEFVVSLAWKSAAMVCGGAAITFLGVYVLLVQMKLL